MCAQFKRKKFKSAQIAIEQTAHILELKVKQKIHILKEKEMNLNLNKMDKKHLNNILV